MNSLVCPIVSRKESGNHERPDRIGSIAAPLLIGMLNAPPIGAPQQAGASVTFEVVSVKPNQSTELRSMQMQVLPGGTLTYKNVPLRAIISQAYNLPFNSPEWITGPKWIDSEKFDIEARAPQGVFPAGLPEKQRNEKSLTMLRTILADRFRMTTHWEIKQGPVYALSAAKNGLKLHQAKTPEKDCPEVSTRTENCHIVMGGQGNGLHARAISITDLVNGLNNFSDHPIVDHTGLKELFDIDTEGWVPMRPRPGPPPGIEPSAEDRAFADPGRPTLQQVLDIGQSRPA